MADCSEKRPGNIIYFSHGGGPLPILGDPSHAAMIAFMKELPRQLPKPEAVVVVSAHWEEPLPTIIGAEAPSLFYDYYGFPKEAYELQYPAPGAPRLAQTMQRALQGAGIASRIDERRGFDHGLFIPLKMMYPDADIPMTQLSLIRGLEPQQHIALGRALRSLADENILIIGSGFSFHNMRAFTWDSSNQEDPANDEFQEWLIDVCTGDYSSSEREEKLTAWTDAPHARYCHPREEHLLPLHVCLGMSGQKARLVFDDHILGKRAIALQFC